MKNGIVLTTAKAARVLGLHESSIKRWCNEDRIPIHKTDGGHRRIHFDDLLHFANVEGHHTPLATFGDDAKFVWDALETFERSGSLQPAVELVLHWTQSRELHRIVDFFRHVGRRDDLPLIDVFDNLLRPVMAQVGEWWAEGEISVSHEHIVSKSFQHALFALSEVRRHAAPPPTPSEDERKLAIVGCAEGNDHEIGAFCVKIMLDEFGWDACYLGANVPTVEYATMQRKMNAELVCISYSGCSSASDIFRDLRVLKDLFAGATPYHLAIGGGHVELDPDKDPTPFGALGGFHGLAPFSDWLGEQFPAD